MIRFRKTISSLLLTSVLTISGLLINSNTTYASESITINRISGQDRYETSVKLSQYWKQRSDYAVLVNSEDYPDAVSVAPLARKFEAPILLVTKDGIPNIVKTELQRLKTKKVFIIGGTGVVSTNVENELRNLGINIEERIAGKDRFETSTKIAHHLVSMRNDVYVVENGDWQNALAIAPVASYRNSPIVLVDKNSGVADTIKQNIANEFHTYFLIGEKGNQNFVYQAENGLGQGTGKGISVKALGDTKESTNLEIYNSFKDTGNIETDGALKLDRVYLVSNKGLADALSLGYIAGENRSLILFINENNLTPTVNFLNQNSSKIKDVVVVGGEGILPQKVVDKLYNGMVSSKAIQDEQAKSDYQDKWNDENTVIIQNPDAYVEPPITFWEGCKILGTYLNINPNNVYGVDGQMGVNMLEFNDITLSDGNNLASKMRSHMCTFVDTDGSSDSNYSVILDRNTGDLYEKVDKNNKNSKAYRLVKNVLSK